MKNEHQSDFALRDKIMEEQLERRRRSNREAQRRRRARLKEQENGPLPDPPPPKDFLEYEFVMRESRLMPVHPKPGRNSPLHNKHANHVVPNKGGCCGNNAPLARPDSLYPEEFRHGHHPGKSGKLGYSGPPPPGYSYERYRGHPMHDPDPQHGDKHYFYPSPQHSPQDPERHHHYPHYYRDTYPRESGKPEHRYHHHHDVPHHYHGGRGDDVVLDRHRRHVEDYDVKNGRRGEGYDVKKCTRVPSLSNGYEVVTYDEVRNDRSKPSCKFKTIYFLHKDHLRRHHSRGK